jgi:hypothetical protein
VKDGNLNPYVGFKALKKDIDKNEMDYLATLRKEKAASKAAALNPNAKRSTT